MKFVKGRGKEGESDRRSISSFGSRTSVAQMTAGSVSPSVSLSKAPMRLLQSSWSLSQEDGSLVDPNTSKLHLAAGAGKEEKVLKYLKKLDVNVLDGQGRTPLHLSCAGGHLRVSRLLAEAGARLDLQDRRGVTALGRAVEAAHLEVVQLLQERGAGLEVPDERGETSVHLAVRAGMTDILSLLVRRGANPDIINYQGESPLHLAVTNTDLASVNILLRAGALVNIRSHNLVTPLMLAARTGKEDLVATLLEFDARVEEEDQAGNKALVYARNNTQIIELLERYDQSTQPVTHFPSRTEPVQEPHGAEVEEVKEVEEGDLELDSWQDSLPLSEDGFTTDNKLVKSWQRPQSLQTCQG